MGSAIFQSVFVIFSKPESREYGFIHGGQSLWKSKTFNQVCIRHTTLSVVVNGGGTDLTLLSFDDTSFEGYHRHRVLERIPMYFPLYIDMERSNR